MLHDKDFDSLPHFERKEALRSAMASCLEAIFLKIQVAGQELSEIEIQNARELVDVFSYPENLKGHLFEGMQELKKRRIPGILRNAFLSEPEKYWDLYLDFTDAFDSTPGGQIVADELSTMSNLINRLANPMATPGMDRFFGWLNNYLSENEANYLVAIANDALKGLIMRKDEGDIIYWLMTFPIAVASVGSFNPVNTSGTPMNPYNLFSTVEKLVSKASNSAEAAASLRVRIG